MSVKGCGRFIKYTMFLFNALILIAGCALVGFGIYTRTNQSSVTKFSSILGSNLLPTVTLVVIITGSIIILLSFLGCCGAIKEVRCMLVTFFLMLLLLFVSFLVGGILFYAFRTSDTIMGKHMIEDVTLSQLMKQLNLSYGKKGEEPVTEGWDYMQKIFQCCGVSGNINSSDSWAYYKRNTDWFDMQPQGAPVFVPTSCCKDPENTPNISKCQGHRDTTIIPYTDPPVYIHQLNDQLYTEGCYTAFYKLIQENINILIGIAAGIGIAMIVEMVFSMCLCRIIREDDYYECDDD